MNALDLIVEPDFITVPILASKGGLAVTPDPRERWAVVHVASGVPLCRYYTERGAMGGLQRWLATGIDWTLSKDRLVAMGAPPGLQRSEEEKDDRAGRLLDLMECVLDYNETWPDGAFRRVVELIQAELEATS